MVTNAFKISAAAALLAALAVGCARIGAPVHPKGGAPTLLLKSPVGPGAQWMPGSNVAIKYRVAGKDHGPVTGAVTVLAGQTLDKLSIPLPSNGPKVVSAEWFELRGSAYPRYLGADRVEVLGDTPFNLRMGMLDGCYQYYMLSYNYFSFNTGGPVSIGDNNLYLAVPMTDQASLEGVNGALLTYLGNGDLVDHVEIPAAGPFHPTTYAAKGNAGLAVGDVFGVRIPAENANAWVQVTMVYTNFTNAEIEFSYRYNDQNDPLCVFDETQYGHDNCNETTVGF